MTTEQEINQVRTEIDAINARMKELKHENHKAVARLDALLRKQCIESYPFPMGTRVNVTVQDEMGYKHLIPAYLGEPEPGGFGKPYRMGFFKVLPDGSKSNLRVAVQRKWKDDKILSIEKAE